MRDEMLTPKGSDSVNKDLPLVSVIIPVYNVAPYLRASLESVISQTYHDLEILVIDDGSTDGSGAICDEYEGRDPRIRVAHQENRGLSGARNTGLRMMTGDVVAFLDSDDRFYPDAVEAMVGAMEKDGSDISICRFERTEKWIITSEPIEGTFSSHEAFGLLMGRKIGFSVCSKFFRSALWSGIQFPEKRNFEDAAVLHLLLYRAERVSLINRDLIRYQGRPGSITHDCSSRNAEDWVWSYSHLPLFISEHTPAEFTEAELNAAYQFVLRKAMSRYNRLYLYEPVKSAPARKILREAIIQLGEKVNTTCLSERIGYDVIVHFPAAGPFMWAVFRSSRRLSSWLKGKNTKTKHRAGSSQDSNGEDSEILQ